MQTGTEAWTRRHCGAGALMQKPPTMCLTHRSPLVADTTSAHLMPAVLSPGHGWLATNKGLLALQVITTVVGGSRMKVCSSVGCP